MQSRFAIGFLLVLTLGLPQSRAAEHSAESTPPPPAVGEPPAGAYTVDKPHASLIFKVDHLGFSNFTARFTRFDVQLRFDPDHLPASSVAATIDPRSIESDNAPAGFMDMLRAAQWLDTPQYPQMTFRSTQIELTAPHTMRIRGDFTLHGITRPVTLEATFNGGYAGHPMDPHARIGFSAHGALKRSQFGIAYGVPTPGSRMGVGDDVDIIIEAEFNGPAWAAAPRASR